MTLKTMYEILLLLATLLNATCFGYLLLFATVVMPGIGQLSDGEFLQAFQVIDGIIQDNQPIFILSWVGSFLSLVVLAFMTIANADFSSTGNKKLILSATVLTMAAQIITGTVHIPRNNRVHSLMIDELDENTLAEERDMFEASWNLWNIIRTVFFGLSSCMLCLILLRHEPSLDKPKQQAEVESILEGSHLQARYT